MINRLLSNGRKTLSGASSRKYNARPQSTASRLQRNNEYCARGFNCEIFLRATTVAKCLRHDSGHKPITLKVYLSAGNRICAAFTWREPWHKFNGAGDYNYQAARLSMNSGALEVSRAINQACSIIIKQSEMEKLWPLKACMALGGPAEAPYSPIPIADDAYRCGHLKKHQYNEASGNGG